MHARIANFPAMTAFDRMRGRSFPDAQAAPHSTCSATLRFRARRAWDGARAARTGTSRCSTLRQRLELWVRAHRSKSLRDSRMSSAIEAT